MMHAKDKSTVRPPTPPDRGKGKPVPSGEWRDSHQLVGQKEPSAVVELQRSVGNRGTTMLIAGNGRTAAPIVQRDGSQTKQPGAPTTDVVPNVGDMGQTAMTWIAEVWGALNQGLADFEHNAQVTDWAAFSGNLLGNLIWAAAAFSTGGAAFAISLVGIGAATAATAPSSRDDFFVAARAEHDALNTALKGRTPQVTKEVHDAAVAKGWSSTKTYQKLMHLLLQPDYMLLVGGIPSVNSPRIAALVEQQLHLRTGSTRSTGWSGFEHGNWWVNYEYRVDDAQQPMGLPAPLGQWRLHRERENAQLLPIDTDVRNARERLNAVAATLGGAQRPAEWPLRKELTVYFRGSRAITVSLSPDNRIVGTGAWYMSKEEMQQLSEAAGWSDLGSGLLSWVWADSGGRPPPIATLT